MTTRPSGKSPAKAIQTERWVLRRRWITKVALRHSGMIQREKNDRPKQGQARQKEGPRKTGPVCGGVDAVNPDKRETKGDHPANPALDVDPCPVDPCPDDIHRREALPACRSD